LSIGVLVRADRNQAWFYSLVVGTAVFIYVTGGAIINPTSRDWLMFGDAAQHYLGWEFFRHTPLLQWPIGANYPLGMELSSSIVFTDSIPIAAYIAKLFNPILPETFQYLGIWIWLCFVLQAFFAQRFLKFFLSNKAHVYLGACFVVLSPPLVYRLVHAGYGHIALASHWLILASFCLYIRPGRNDLRWSLLIALCWLIQAYFAPMVTAIWLASLVKRLYIGNEKFPLLRSVSIVAITSFIVMWASGYFMIGSNFNPDGWNYVFRWQPLSLVDSGTDGSNGWSRLLLDRDQLAGEGEAFSFLGVGIIFLMAVSFVRITFQFRRRPKLVLLTTITTLTLLLVSFVLSIPPLRVISMGALLVIVTFSSAILLAISRNSDTRRSYGPLMIAVCVLTVYSMTNRVGFAQQTLFEYSLFPPLRQFTETFRTHGRSIWPFFYILILGVIVYVSRAFPRRTASALLFAALIIQVIDSAPAVSLARDRFINAAPWVTPLSDPRWSELAEEYSNIVIVPTLNDDPNELWIAIDELAISTGLNTNSGNFSRFDEKALTRYNEQLFLRLRDGTVDSDSIFVVVDPELETFLRGREGSSFAMLEINGFLVVAP
jgi:hypothetical protein